MTTSRDRFGRDIGLRSVEAVSYHVAAPVSGVAESRAGRLKPIETTQDRAAIFGVDEPFEIRWRGDCEPRPREHAMQLQLQRDDSGNGAGSSLTVQPSVLRPAVPLLRTAGELTGATATKLVDVVQREFLKRPYALVLDMSELSVMDIEAVPAPVDLASRAAETNAVSALMR
ncbi:MAG: Transcriptional regulator, AraC family [Mycobacterium sp.]|nr:Transcriptional regulator, AraC family [Mycobacterium sp.]